MTRRLLFLLLSTTCLIATSAFAGDDAYTRIARLSYLTGNVSFQHRSDADWSAASINMPMEPGDRIYTGRDGRTEIEFDDGSVFRLAENSDVEILSLREDLIQLRILVGLSTLTVTSNIDFEINTPAAAFNVLRKGVYRFDVVESGDTDAIVREGELEAANNEFSRRIQPGELLHLSRGDDGNPKLSRYEQRDPWDEWNDRRTADRIAYESRKYMPDTVNIGASDLDRYGRWVYVDGYGAGWAPFSVNAYWSPYSVGRWCYRPIYGWTWVSYEPWGWLPYHYGRWYNSVRFGWCWLPGPSFSFNFWAPALVTFYNGPGWISWCPLGPGDWYDINRYHYNHRHHHYQMNHLKALHTRAPGDPFHRNSHGAFRTAAVDRFRHGIFNDRNDGNWTNVDQPWRRGSIVRNGEPVQPTAASYRPAPDRAVARPSGYRELPVVVRQNPGSDAGNRERFSVITNPKTASPPSRVRSRTDSETANAGINSKPGGRAAQTPRRESINRGVQTPPGDASTTQDQQRMATPRRPENRGNATANRGNTIVDVPSGPSGNRARSVQQNPSRQSNGNKAPEQRQTPQNAPRERKENKPLEQSKPPEKAPVAQPRNGERQQNSYSESRSREWNRSSSYRQPESAGDITTFIIPRQSTPVSSAPRNSSSTYVSPRQSSPAIEWNSAGRSYSSPSAGSSGGYSGGRSHSNPSQNYGRGSSALASGRSSGGESSSRDSGDAVRARDAGSSGKSRGRR
jgi:hypothetical protein